jgi:methionyl aminopeptidase
MSNRATVKTPKEIAIMREAGRIVAETLALMAAQVRPGMTTDDLDRMAYEHITKRGAVPSFKGHHGYTKSICTSINEEIVHGIPGPRVLVEGDLLSLDCGAFYRGFHGDSGLTVPVGAISAEAQRIMDVAAQALDVGIATVGPGVHVGDVGAAIYDVIKAAGYETPRELSGHGVGRQLWEEPKVPNYGERGKGFTLVPGIVIAIEPMLMGGTYRTRTLSDGWTIVTADGQLSSYIEHTVAVTDNGPEILTLP